MGGGFVLAAAPTSSAALCTSRHGMRQPAVAYRHSIRYQDVYGIGAQWAGRFVATAFAEPPKEASAQRHRAMTEGKTCVDCPRGPVHRLPAVASATPVAAPAGAAPAPAAGKVALSPGATAFARGETPLTADAKGTPFGTVTPGTPLQVVKQAGNLAEVHIDGWSMVGAEQVVFAAKGQRIALARLSSPHPGNRRVTGTSRDTYGIDWQHVVVTGWVPSSDLVDNVAVVWQAADAFYQKRCTACHALHQPDEFTANQWPSILKIMAQRAGLTGPEKELVTKFVQTHAGKPGASHSSGQNAHPSRR